MDDVRIAELLDRSDRCWPAGGAETNPNLTEVVQPLLDKLEKADRSQARCEKDVDFAGRQLAALTEGIERFGERRDALLQSVFRLKAGASRSRASSESVELQRKARERAQEIREFDERFVGYREKLLVAERDLQNKQSTLRYLQTNVSRLEHAIVQFFPRTARADDNETMAGPDCTGDTGDHGSAQLDAGENVVSWENARPSACVRTRSAAPIGATRTIGTGRATHTQRPRRLRRVRRRIRVGRR